jgi:hypothetical protein
MQQNYLYDAGVVFIPPFSVSKWWSTTFYYARFLEMNKSEWSIMRGRLTPYFGRSMHTAAWHQLTDPQSLWKKEKKRIMILYNCITTGEKMSECVTKNITVSGNIYNAVIYDFFVSRTHHSSHNNKFLSQRNYINWMREHIFICDNFKHSSNCLIIKRAHNYRELATLALNMWNNMYETASHHRDEEVHEYDDTTVLEFHI